MNESKKLSWFQKIRDYDELEYDLGMWMTIAIEKSNELELMTKVADNWQAKLIEQNKTIGRRLKYSVGHNHITIIVGCPITVVENYNEYLYGKDGTSTDTDYSVCSKKDAYNWKTGAIQALENLCRDWEYGKDLRRDLMKGLAKKYPEVFR